MKSAYQMLVASSIWFNEAYNGVGGRTLCASEELKKQEGKLNLTWFINGLLGPDHTAEALGRAIEKGTNVEAGKATVGHKIAVLVLFPFGPIAGTVGFGLRKLNILKGTV